MSSGAFALPLQASAGFFSNILSKEVSANSEGLIMPEINDNAQTMALLQANMAVLPLPKVEKEEEASISDDASVSIMSETALVPSVSPQSITGGVGEGDLPIVEDMSVYVVRKGDSLSQIADMFGVSTNTILWGNDLKKGAKLSEGDILLILPVSGVKHVVKSGQTVASIAKMYKVDVETVTSFNSITSSTKLAVGDELIIPEGQMPTEATATPPKPKKNAPLPKYDSNLASNNTNGYYINPVPELKRKSQGFHGNNSVDLAASTGTRILAAASGKVLLARTGYNGGYGNMVIIEHPNGTKTLYAHMVRLGTSSGAQVSQGEVIGYVGSTGRSTGPHLHFEVHGAKNPGTDWSWKPN